MSRPSRQSPLPSSRGSLSHTVVAWLVGALIVGLLTLMLVLTGHVSTLNGRRESAGAAYTAVLENSFLQIIPLGKTELSGLREATLEQSADLKKRNSYTYRVMFATDSGPVPMTAFFRGGREAHQDVVDRVNVLLRDEKSNSFSLRHVGAGWFAIVPAAVVLAIAVAGVVLAIHILTQALLLVWPRGAAAEVSLTNRRRPARFRRASSELN
ncbi:MAG TPA: hypothetical protein VGE52_20315 [Pirellulales bacterium]